MSPSSANSNRWTTSPATPIAADTILCAKSLALTTTDCGRKPTSGSRVSVPCWPPPKRQLTQQHRVTREVVSGLYLYTAMDRTIQRGQLLTRRTVEALPTVPDPSRLAVSEEELKASILLFYSLLDEQQRRLYAGLESLKLGRGGDHQLADFLDLDPHTVARGRRQLLAQDVEVDRARRTGGGRKPVEKKRPK